MLVTVYTSNRVTVGSPEYRAAMVEAQGVASRHTVLGLGGYARWADDYNDHSATGRFIVTARAVTTKAA